MHASVHTFASALALIGTTVPDHLVADAEVPVLTDPQAQGDLLVVPWTADWDVFYQAYGSFWERASAGAPRSSPPTRPPPPAMTGAA
jgi:hypothetical protein